MNQITLDGVTYNLVPVEPEQVEPEPAKFKVGDRVEHAKHGRGTVVLVIPKNYAPYAVEFDYPNRLFHDCRGHCRNGHGWWCAEDHLTPLADIRPAFLVGDEVTSVKGVVTDIDYDDIDRDVNPYRVTFGDDGYAYLRDTHLVLVTPKE
jgi:hypothetical protein